MKGDTTQESNDSHKIPDMEQNRHPWPHCSKKKANIVVHPDHTLNHQYTLPRCHF